MPTFSEFPLQSATRAVLTNMKITQPSPIQAGAIPVLLAGKDLVGQSATGSGKTLAYSIPLVERISKDKRVVQALVLVPTRELAVQVNVVLSQLAAARRMSTALLVGGRPYNPQISALRYGAQIVVGTPGRVKDHLERGTLTLTRLRICVLDEADQMLDSGFAPEIEEILTTTPETRQMALFSATMPDWVAKIQEKFLKEPVKVEIQAAAGAESTIEQIAYQIPKDQKMAALCTLLNSTEGGSSLIFGKTKYGVEKLGKQLANLGFTVGTLHGNKSQRAREEVLSAFRRGHVQTLLATNVAARGLDIQGINQVINYELPESSELFTHRIGRTGRMGHHGKAITLLTPADVSKWRRMSRNLGQAVSLQQLAIDKDALAARPIVVAEPVFEPRSGSRPERNHAYASPAPNPARGRRHEMEAPNPARGRRHEMEAPNPARGRRHEMEAPNPARGRRYEMEAPNSTEAKPRAKKVRVNTAPTWKSEEFVSPERFAGNKERYGKRAAGLPAGSGRDKMKRKAYISFEAESQYPDDNKRSGRGRRRVASAGRSNRR